MRNQSRQTITIIGPHGILRKVGRILLCTGLACLNVFAHAQTVLHTAAQSDTAPKFIARSDSPTAPIEGLCIDIDRALERIDPHLQIVGDQSWMPASRIDVDLNNGKLDFACAISKTPSRLKTFNFIEPPLFTTEYVLIVRADDPVNVRKWEDIRALGSDGVILVDHGFGLASRLTMIDGLIIDDGTVGARKNFLKLQAKRGRFYYHRLLGLIDEIKRADMLGKVRMLPVLMDRQPFYMVFGPHAPKEAIEQTQRAIAELARSGELMRIQKKWSAPANELDQRTSKLIDSNSKRK
jgi:polar amino acid transport system substrate-binding protein